MNEIYVSTDVETDGPIPGVNSMLSFASAAFLTDKTLISTFSANLETLPEATTDPRTMDFWQKQPIAWQATRENCQNPQIAMKNYFNWLKELPGKPVLVGFPVAFDFMFIYWYLMRFVGESPFSFSALDIKTYAMALLKKPYRKTVKHEMPKHWIDPNFLHTHIALDDALEQGYLFCNMLEENLKINE